MEELKKLINNLKKSRNLNSLDEAATKQYIVLNILKILGWDPFNIDEVRPEYSVGKQKVDYALRYRGRNKVFIEVKKVNENLEKHQEQLLTYSFKEGIKLAVLTNGISWWFYLPLHEGNWEQRKFFTIEIYDQPTEEIVEKFISFLLKDNVITDEAIKNAENLYKSKQKFILIKETLPKAFEKMISEPDQKLVELLAEKVEKICGYKPSERTVENYLAEIETNFNKNLRVSVAKQEISKKSTIEKNTINEKISYTNRKISSFIFKNKFYEVNSWKEFLIKIIEILVQDHKNEFEKVLELKGKKRPYFSENKKDLRIPYRIKNTKVYVETNLSANAIVAIIKKVISLFGYTESELTIKFE